MAKHTSEKTLTKNTVEQFIGLRIDFAQSNYEYNVMLLNRIVKLANDIVDLYLKLGLEKEVKTSFLIDIEHNGINTIMQNYLLRTKIMIEKVLPGEAGKQAYLAEAEKDLIPLRSAIEDLKKAQVNLTSGTIASYHASLEYLDIENNKVIFGDEGKKALKDHYSIFITTIEEAEIWDNFLRLKTSFDELVGKLKVLGWQIHSNLNPLCSSHGFIYESYPTCQLGIRTDFFPSLKQLIAKKRKADNE